MEPFLNHHYYKLFLWQSIEESLLLLIFYFYVNYKQPDSKEKQMIGEKGKQLQE